MRFLTAYVILALAACVSSRSTTFNSPGSITPQITSLTDKDARQKASTHPAFANAGRRAGVEIWRIKQFEPQPVSEREFGKFHKGDSYIVLKTTSDKRGQLSWDIYYWIGAESTQDESGAAAILTVGLDDKFGGAAVQHRETQGYESQQFTHLFPSGVSYLDGGHATGFNHVITNAGAEKRLIQVKGKTNVRVRQVDPLISSMNQGDVFILDLDNRIYVYVGDKARNVEKLKGASVAAQIRDQDHRGRATVQTIEKYSSEADYQEFFNALGSGAKNLVPDESAGGDDKEFERKEQQSIILSEVSDSTGKVKVTPLSKPFKQEQLKPQEAYILDTISGSVYVWIGKQATQKEKTEAVAKAEQLKSSKNYPSWVRVERVLQNTEPAIFKQYFSTWRDAGMSHSRIVRSVGEEYYEDYTVKPKPVLFSVVREGNRLVLDNELRLHQKSINTNGIYWLKNGLKVYLWIGNDVTERKPAREVKNYLENLGLTVLPEINQGSEPEEFKNLFGYWDHKYFENNLKLQEDISKEGALLTNEIA